MSNQYQLEKSSNYPNAKKSSDTYRHRIVVTHFINPHLFWYYIDTPETFSRVLEIESNLLEVCNRDNAACPFTPNLGEIVAVQYLPFGKCIRGKILHLDKENEISIYIIWAIDHGFPFASYGKYIWPVHTTFCGTSDRIICGGIANVYAKTPDPMIQPDIHARELEWSDVACELVEILMKKATVITFYHLFLTGNKKQWGFLNIKTQDGSDYRIDNILKKYDFSQSANGNFRYNSAYLKSLNHCPWLSNCGKIIYKFNKIENIPKISNIQNRLLISRNGKASTHASPKVLEILDEIFERTNGFKNDLNIDKNRTENNGDDAVQKFRDLRSRLKFNTNDCANNYCRHKNCNDANQNKMKSQIDNEDRAFDNKLSEFNELNSSEKNLISNEAPDLPKVRTTHNKVAKVEESKLETDVKNQVSSNTKRAEQEGLNKTKLCLYSKVMQFLVNNKDRLFANIVPDKGNVMNLNQTNLISKTHNPLQVVPEKGKTANTFVSAMKQGLTLFNVEKDIKEQNKQDFRFNNAESLANIAKAFLLKKQNSEHQSVPTLKNITSNVECNGDSNLKHDFNKIDKLLENDGEFEPLNYNYEGLHDSVADTLLHDKVINSEESSNKEMVSKVMSKSNTKSLGKEKIVSEWYLSEYEIVSSPNNMSLLETNSLNNEKLLPIIEKPVASKTEFEILENETTSGIKKQIVQNWDKYSQKENGPPNKIVNDNSKVNIQKTENVGLLNVNTSTIANKEESNLKNEEVSAGEIVNLITEKDPSGEIVNRIEKNGEVYSNQTNVELTSAILSSREIVNAIKEEEPLQSKKINVESTSVISKIVNCIEEDKPFLSKEGEIKLKSVISFNDDKVNHIEENDPFFSNETIVKFKSDTSSSVNIVNAIKEEKLLLGNQTNTETISAILCASEQEDTMKQDESFCSIEREVELTSVISCSGEIFVPPIEGDELFSNNKTNVDSTSVISASGELVNCTKDVKPLFGKEIDVQSLTDISSNGNKVNCLEESTILHSNEINIVSTSVISVSDEMVNCFEETKSLNSTEIDIDPKSVISSNNEIVNRIPENKPLHSNETNVESTSVISSIDEIVNFIKEEETFQSNKAKANKTFAIPSSRAILYNFKKDESLITNEILVESTSVNSSSRGIVNLFKKHENHLSNECYDETPIISSVYGLQKLIKNNENNEELITLIKPTGDTVNSIREEKSLLSISNNLNFKEEEKEIFVQTEDNENNKQLVVVGETSTTLKLKDVLNVEESESENSASVKEIDEIRNLHLRENESTDSNIKNEIGTNAKRELRIKQNTILMQIPVIQESCWQKKLHLKSDFWSDEEEGEIEFHLKVLDYNKINKRDIDNSVLFDDGVAHINSFLKKADEDYCLISEDLNENVKQMIKTNEDDAIKMGRTSIRSLIGTSHVKCSEELPQVLSEADRKQNVFKTFEQRNAIDPLIEYKNKLNIRQLCYETTFNDNIVLKTKEPILLHSKFSYLPIHSLRYYELYEPIQEKLANLHITELKHLQAYAWPLLLHGHSICLLSEEKSGKTLCYLPAICHLLALRKSHYYIPKSFGPVAIIILHEQFQIQPIKELCEDMLKSTKCKIITSLGIRNIVQTQFQLLSGCDILLITPSSLRLLLTHGELGSLIDSQRFMHLVIDDIDKMVAQSKDDLEYVLRRLIKIAKPQVLQMVVTSSTWQRILSTILRQFKDLALLIADFAEATFYANTDMKLKLSSSAHKLEILANFMNDLSYKNERTIVLCKTPEDILTVVGYLKNNGHAFINFEEDSSKENYNKFLKLTEDETTAVCLVCTDNNIYKILQSPNFENVVHFSIPSTWTSFARRFATMANNIHNFVVKGLNDLPVTSGTKSLILLDEENHIVFRTLIDMMKRRSGINIHPNILAVADKISEESEILKVNNRKTICRYILEFAECTKLRCEYRHRFATYDKCNDEECIPSSGDMRVKIIKVISPSHFLARPLEYRSNDFEEFQQIRRSKELPIFEMKLNLHYLNEDNLIVLNSPTIGDLCIYKITEIPYRAKIIDISNNKDADAAICLKFTLKLIDVGTIVSTMNPNLIYTCDEQFENFPAQAIDIHLLGVVPCYNERHWEYSIKEVLQDLLSAKFHSKQCVHIKINFAVGNIVWVSAFNIYENLKTLNMWSVKHKIKKLLIDEKYAVLSSEVAIKLRELAQEFTNKEQNNISTADEKEREAIERVIEEKEKEIVEKDTETEREREEKNNKEVDLQHSMELVASQSALNKLEEFDLSSTELYDEWISIPLNQVLPIKLGNTDFWPQIYVQIINDETAFILNDLQAKIDQYIEQIKRNSNYIFPEHLLSHNTDCIAKRGQHYARAKFHTKKKSNDSIEFWFFLCDYGEFVVVDEITLKSEFLYETTIELLSFALYQAVYCQVINSAEWNFSDSDTIFYIKANGKNSTDNRFYMNNYNVTISNMDNMDKEVFWEEDRNFTPFGWMQENIVGTSENDNKRPLLSGDNLVKAMVKFAAITKLESINRAYEDVIVIKAESVNNRPRFEVQIIEEKGGCSDMAKSMQNELNIFSNINAAKSDHFESQFHNSPKLKQLFECPLTTWCQTNFLISLKIHAPDIQTYNLNVTDETLIFATTINEKKSVVILNFLGLVDSERVVHELRGLFVYIKLFKRVLMMWPRLLQQEHKMNFIKKDTNIYEEEMLKNPIEIRSKNMRLYADNDDHESERIEKEFSEEEDEYEIDF